MIKAVEYIKPKSKEEAVKVLSVPGSKVLAGGTDLLVNMRNKVISPEVLVDIKGIEDLKGIRVENDKLFIGATVTINEIVEDEKIEKKYPILKEAGSVLASYQVRNRATVGGNLCNASPAADMASPLLVLQAKAVIYGNEGIKELSLKDFFLGVKKTVLKQDEILVGISIPVSDGHGKYYKKSRIKGHDLSIVGVAGYRMDDYLYFGIGACAITPKLIEVDVKGLGKEEAIKVSKEKILSEVNPITDIRATAEYRRAMLEVFVEKIVNEIM
ncbi:FAD binding domain-containing protein [Thermovenabulum sp.]|uniref:FAD binding domain-containing protein n=1 Tax=Thermovenabulum sp. TaxID=3100335 RepID=UPI003C7E6640